MSTEVAMEVASETAKRGYWLVNELVPKWCFFPSYTGGYTTSYI